MANTAVFGIYANVRGAESAIADMKAAGFRNADISVLLPENVGTKDLAFAKGTKAPEGAAAGPIMAALSGVGVGGALGGLTGALVGMGIPEYEAKRYEGLVKDGGILVSVHADDSKWTKLAKEILERTGATDIASTGETKGDYANSEKPVTTGPVR